MPIRHTANQPTLVDFPFPRTATPAVADGREAAGTGGRRCQTSTRGRADAAAAATPAAGGAGCSGSSPTPTSAANTARAAQRAHPAENSAG